MPPNYQRVGNNDAGATNSGSAADRELVRETLQYVASQSTDSDMWISKRRRQQAKELKTRTTSLRIILMVLGFASMLIDLVAAGISATADTNYKTVARTAAVIASFLVTIASTAIGGVGALDTYVLLTSACTILDASMTTLLDKSNDLFIVGIIAIVVRIIAIIVGFVGITRNNRISASEQLYLHIADKDVRRDWEMFEEAVAANARNGNNDCGGAGANDNNGDTSTFTKDTSGNAYVAAGDGGLQQHASNGGNTMPPEQEASLRYSILQSIVRQMVVVYNSYVARNEADGGDNEMAAKLQPSTTTVVVGGGGAPASRALGTSTATSASRKLEQWFQVLRVRSSLHSHDKYFINKMGFLLIVLTVLTAGNVAFEFWRIFANQPSLFPDEDGYLDRAFIRRTSFPTREATGLKVHIVVVDGLRDDFTDKGGSVIGDYLNDPSFAADSLRFHARAQLPSFSVPNWMTILSGSPPEDSGVTGNLENGETHYDTIYGIAKEYGVHAGMTGTPWWAKLVQRSLPPLGGDGTIATNVRPVGVPAYEWESGDIADDLRGAVAVQAAKRSTVPNPFGAADTSITTLYELFLTHFSDVDMQGHDYGIDTKYNKRDSYRGAVANKTRLLRNIVDAIDTDTILIVTSDHGHVMRGGHGGESSVLRDVPMFFYRKGSAVSMPTGSNFLPDEQPRVAFDHKYANLDLAATVTSLLGLPSPRQSLGVVFEEVLQAFLPANIRRRCYHDLLLAKINLVQEYKKLLDTTFFTSAVPEVLQSDPNVKKLAETESAFNSATTVTERQYAEMIRVVLADYHKLRNRRFDILFYRNLALSVCVALPALIIIWMACMHSVFMRMAAIITTGHPLQRLNRLQFLGALGTMVLFLFASIVTYIVVYFGVVGQRQWDPTAVHTPSVAVRYLASVFVGPIVFFTLLTKVWLAVNGCLHWRLPEVICEFRALQKQLKPYFVFRWFSYHIPQDMATVLLVTRQFKPSTFVAAHVYTQYLAFFVAWVSILLLFLCFPFSFFLPAVFAVSHVTEWNIVYRFRIITIMFMMVPLQVGTIIMLWYGRPPANAATLRLWDKAFAEGRLEGDLWELTQALERADRKEQGLSQQHGGTEGIVAMPPANVSSTMVATSTSERRASNVDLPMEGSFKLRSATGLHYSQAELRRNVVRDLLAALRNPDYRGDPPTGGDGAPSNQNGTAERGGHAIDGFPNAVFQQHHPLHESITTPTPRQDGAEGSIIKTPREAAKSNQVSSNGVTPNNHSAVVGGEEGDGTTFAHPHQPSPNN